MIQPKILVGSLLEFSWGTIFGVISAKTPCIKIGYIFEDLANSLNFNENSALYGRCIRRQLGCIHAKSDFWVSRNSLKSSFLTHFCMSSILRFIFNRQKVHIPVLGGQNELNGLIALSKGKTINCFQLPCISTSSVKKRTQNGGGWKRGPKKVIFGIFWSFFPPKLREPAWWTMNSVIVCNCEELELFGGFLSFFAKKLFE